MSSSSGAAGVGGVACMHLGRVSPPQQEALDSCRRQRGRCRRRPRLPGTSAGSRRSWCRREIGIEQQTGLSDTILSCRPSSGRCTSPRCGGTARRWRCAPACRWRDPTPRGLALVGDADTGEVPGLELGFGQGAAADLDGGPPDLSGSCSTQPAWERSAAIPSAPRRPPAGGVEHDGAVLSCPGRWRGCAAGHAGRD